MSQIEKEITGIVSTFVPKSMLNVNTRPPDNLSLRDAAVMFTQCCKQLFRINGLSSKKHFKKYDGNQPSQRRDIAFCIAGVMEALRFHGDMYSQLQGMHYSLMDGTPAFEQENEMEFSRCITNINIHPSEDGIIIAVVLSNTRSRRSNMAWNETEAGSISPFFFVISNDDVARMYAQGIDKSVLEISELVVHHNQNTMESLYKDFLTKSILTNIFSAVTEYPTCAAMFDGETIWTAKRPYSHRHIVNSQEFSTTNRFIHGFITNHGNFINRYRAAYLAHKQRLYRNPDEFNIGISIISSTNLTIPTLDRKCCGITIFDGRDTALRYTPISPDDYLVSSTPLLTEDIW